MSKTIAPFGRPLYVMLKHEALPQQCKECKYEFACHGECPKNRFTRDRYGNPGLNYLCRGYYQFFETISCKQYGKD
jgi:uncharacterized protein